MIVGSAPAYPHGVMDPIAEIAAVAQTRGLWMHVDACVGGYIAPFAQQLGYPVEAFDFSVPGVTSISADLHKYGYSAKGASTLFFADRGVVRAHGLPLRQLAAWPVHDEHPGRHARRAAPSPRPGR